MNLYIKSTFFVCAMSISLSAELYITYFDHGEIKAKTHYIDGTNTDSLEGTKHGLQTVYYEMGRIAYSVNYINDKRDGKLTWHDKKGHKLSDVFYKNGKLEGMESSYFIDGSLKHSVNYVNDKKEGAQKEYFNNGIVALVVTYKNNKKEGFQKEYNEDGTLFSSVNYKNNYKEGEQKWFSKDGKVIKTLLYKNDRPINVMKQVQVKQKEYNIYVDSIDFSPQNVE
ncbi:toxin-antitoxin system YwqK family antitoxin [Sulfurimonas sp.]|jgi:antitoxin component YwqK of YwqJK toxin-antitoxin module|uniref:toxin-antitoxin system YwqK family antitoxin n=1 Tax=Sulfurimonas sp. TaxID=2022749 RepID=UPI0025FA5EE7|nr:toxin-antitoxin system YwqK family antitoxin [Sulfurimonas sp.]MBT5935951.1 toxin-antitoxin system YwqK family antitoxin [Sulfurimonas sp.]